MKRIKKTLSSAVDHLRLKALMHAGAELRRLPSAQGELSMVEIKGRGPLPPLLFIHGLSAKCIDWDRVIFRLLPYTQGIRAIDLPGHGWSDTPRDGMGQGPFLKMLMEGSERFLDTPHHIIGSSLGGLMSVRLAQHNARSIRSLSLIAPAGAMCTQAQLDTILGNFDVEDWSKALTFVDACMGENPSIPALMAIAIQSRVAQPSIQELLRQFSLAWLLKPEELQSLTPPVLLYWGLQDEILSGASLAFYKGNLPKDRHLFTSPSEGHAPWLDGPMLDGSQTFIQPLLTFWRANEAGASS